MDPRVAFLVVLLLAAPRLGAQETPDPERLKEAIQCLFQGRDEATIRRGAEICLELDHVESMKVLIKVLNGPNPHHRDIVWEVLPRFTDPYARKRVEAELRENAGSAEVRQWCAELLGHYRDAAFAGTLVRALQDRDPAVVRAATRSLGQVGHAAAAPQLLRLCGRKDDPYLRALAAEALARIDARQHRGTFLAALADPDGGVRCALLGSLPGFYAELVEERSLAALADKDWRPRMQAVENLAKVRTKGSVAGLVRAAADARPVVARVAMRALEGLTGLSMLRAQDWAEWWRENEAAFAFPGEASRPATRRQGGTVAKYNGIDLVSDHVAFLIDKSASMAATLEAQGCSKEDAALGELGRVLEGLQGRLTFNVFTYHNEVDRLHPRAVPLTKKSAAAALAFLRAGKLRGNKNIWQALVAVCEDPTLDTVYLLSSGEPEVGLYVHWNRVTLHLRELNRFHKVVVHTVAYNRSQWFRDQLQKIAEVTGGEFQWYQ